MIRKAKDSDAADICSIYNEYVRLTAITFETEEVTEEQMRARIVDISRQGPYLVYESGGHVAGYCYAHDFSQRGAYATTCETTIYLSPMSTGLGIGTRLMKELIEQCRHQGRHSLIAIITSGNTASASLHEKLGFRLVGHLTEAGRKFGEWYGVDYYELLI